MQITKQSGPSMLTPARSMTKEAMQKDFDFEMAEIFTSSLYENGLISKVEKDRISALNREKFSPFYGDIMDI